MNVPRLRFKEFIGAWEVKKLGDIATFSKGKGISKADIDENGKTFCIRYGRNVSMTLRHQVVLFSV